MKEKFSVLFSKIKEKVLIPIANFFKKIGYSLKIFFYKIIEFFNDLIFRDSGKKKNANRRSAAAKNLDDAKQYVKGSENNKTSVFTAIDKGKDDANVADKTIEVKRLPSKDKSSNASGSNDSQEKKGAFTARTRQPLFAVSVIITTAKVAMIALVVLGAALFGGVLGVANAYLGTTPELDLESIQDTDLTTYLYDDEGKLITPYAGMENRDYATLDEIPKLLQQAVISVEDVRFYSHGGVDYKSLISAFLNNFTNDSVRGGSTITQQLIKNQMLTSERSYKRKIQEASLALQLEQKYTKDQILEAYLNTISMGGTNYGVKAAAKDYFGKELDQLTLREMACIAGITQYPYLYNPRTAYYGSNKDKAKDALNNKIDIVLKDMYTAGYISLEEYEAALKDELVVKEKSDVADMYDMPHFVEYAISNVVDQFIKQRGLEDTSANRSAIENEIRKGGYRIYTTVDREMQTTLEDTIENYNKYPSMRNKKYNVKKQKLADGSTIEVPQPQVAAVVMENDTGYVKAIVGSREVPTIKKSTNRATDSKMPVGSSIKPISVYGPAFDSGCGLVTPIENIKAPIAGWGTADGYPLSSHGSKYGPVTIRKGITSSLNIVAARTLMQHVTVDKSYNYLMKLGFDEKKINKDGIGLALGTSGISMLELTSAYTAIANAGTYLEPMAFTKITDSEGNTVLTASDTQDSFELYKRSSSYMLVEALKSAVQGGTGTTAQISGMTVAGKTGTNVENKCVVFAGITPYYTSCVWIGHDDYVELQYGASGKTTAAPLWQSYMSKILKGYENKPILEGSASDYGVTTVTLCSLSGKRATSLCSEDKTNPPVTDLIAKDSIPSETCDWHVSGNICKDSGCIASEYCPESSIEKGTRVVIPTSSDYSKLSKDALLSIIPNAVISSGEEGETCTIHNEEWSKNNDKLTETIDYANSMIKYAESSIDYYGDRMTASQLRSINSAINDLKRIINEVEPNRTRIMNATDKLESVVDSVIENLPSSTPDPSPTNSPSSVFFRR